MGGAEEELFEVVDAVELHHGAVSLLHADRDVGELRRAHAERVRAGHFELELGAGGEVEVHRLGRGGEAEAHDLEGRGGDSRFLHTEDAHER